MRPVHASDWQAELDLTDREPPFFFRSEDQLTGTSPQPHALRRAFELLELNGVLCTENAPLVYFKLVSRIALDDIRVLYRKFWNHGGAPLLVIISTEEVQIYSALQRPRPCESPSSIPSGLVTSIKRASVALKELLPTVESGEFFRRHSQSFKVSERVDHSLLNNLSATRDKLAPSSHPGVLDSFLCRLVFTCYSSIEELSGGATWRILAFVD